MDRLTLTLDEFYDKVAAALKTKGYERAPDMDTVKFDYENGVDVNTSVEEFAKDWGDPKEEELD